MMHQANYDFKSKMKVNALVISEIARLALGDEDSSSFNTVAEAIEKSPIHDEIAKLAEMISSEANKIRTAA